MAWATWVLIFMASLSDSSSHQCDGRDFFHIHRRVPLRVFASSRAPYFLTHAKARRREVLIVVHYPSDAFLEGRCTEVDKQSDRQVQEAQGQLHRPIRVIPARDPDDGGKPYPPRRKRLIPHSSTSPSLRVPPTFCLTRRREDAKS